jgi:hypothetical protein
MRIRTSLCLLACCAALAACTAAPPKGPNTTVSTPSVGRPPPPASAQAALSREAFTPYAALGLSVNDGLAPGESGFAFAGACMSAAGYPGADIISILRIIHIDLGPTNLAVTQPWGGWGYLGAADAQQYGFRVPPGTVLIDLGFDASLSPPAIPAAEQAAVGKCATILEDYVNAVESGPLAGIATLSNDISTDVQQDAAVKVATRAWSACMAKNGYRFGQSPSNVQQALQVSGGLSPRAPVSASAQQAQLAAAVTDADCTQSSDLAGIYFAVQASYEQQLVTANQQALTAAVSAYRAAYQKELAKLAALLRTAKAQPFSRARRLARKRPAAERTAA